MTSVNAHPHGARQIHLDFHTSRDFSEVAKDFDAEAFAQTMAEAAVSGVNVFAKCHHGYSYYPTKAGTQHPGLSRDLLGEQIAALHRAGIKAPVYVSVLWDDLAAEQHPEWVVTNRFGRQAIRTPLTSDSPLKNQRGWSTLDITSEYGDYVLAQLDEIIDRYDVDGFWLDIVWVEPNYSPSSQKKMRSEGVDMSDEDAVYAWARSGLLSWMGKVRDLLAEKAPNATLFFNGMMDADGADAVAVQTHVEVESLPTSGSVWGYMHFPVMARFARTFDKPMVGMTGRFHKSWADFGGLKPGAQFTYEASTILAAGGAVCFGDQLDPDGVLDSAVYDAIGREYRRVRDLEPHLVDAVPLTEVVVVGSSRISAEGVHFEAVFTDGVEGAVQALLETHIQFDITLGVPEPDGAPLRALLVPGDVELSDSDWERLEQWEANGAAIVLEPDSARAALETSFASRLPVEDIVPSGTDHNYLVAGELDVAGMDTEYPYAVYGPGAALHLSEGARGFGRLHPARFDRTWARFTSHSHAPVSSEISGPLVAVDGRVIVLAAPVMALTKSESYWVYPLVLQAALATVVERFAVVSVEGFQGEVTVQTSDQTDRILVHLVPFHAKRGFSTIPRLDASVALANVAVTIACDGKAARATTVPDGAEVATELVPGFLTLRPALVNGHTVMEIIVDDE